MRKVILFGIILTVLISLSSFNCLAQETKMKELSLAKSIEIGLQNNLDLKQAGYNLELKEAEYEEAKINNLLSTSIISLRTSELTLKKARDSFEEKKKQLILEEIPNKYFEVLKAIRKVEIEQISVEQANENLQMIKNKFSLGDANELDVMQAETGFSSAQLNLTQAENDLTTAKMNFNYTLGLPIDTPIKLTNSFSFEPLQITLEESIRKALQDRYEIVQAQDEVELAKISLSLKQNEYTSEVEQNKAEIELKTKQIDPDKIKKQIRIEITTSFLQLNVKKENVEISRKKEEEKEESYRISQIQYKAGIITTTELLDSQIDLTQAKVNALEALFAYNLAKNQFIKALGGELEKDEEKSS
jgi:outer membrane protein TolC